MTLEEQHAAGQPGAGNLRLLELCSPLA